MKGNDKDWEQRASAMTFPAAVAAAAKKKGMSDADIKACEAKLLQMSLAEMRAEAKKLGLDVYFDWEAARSVEGYYRIQGSNEFCIQRAIAFAPYADAVWMETGKPILSQAKQFATEV